MTILQIAIALFFLAGLLLVGVSTSTEKDRKILPDVDTTFWHRAEISIASVLIITGICLLLRSQLWDLVQWIVNDQPKQDGK